MLLIVYEAPHHPWLSKWSVGFPPEPAGYVGPASGHALRPQTWKQVDGAPEACFVWTEEWSWKLPHHAASKARKENKV